MKNYFILLQQPFFQSAFARNKRQLASTYVFFSLLIGISFAVMWHMAFKQALQWSLALYVALLFAAISTMTACWFAHCRLALLQNSPVNAQLVPDLRKRLMRLTFALWLILPLPLAGVIALYFAHFWQWTLAVELLYLILILILRFPTLFIVPLAVNLFIWPLLDRLIVFASQTGFTNGQAISLLIAQALLAFSMAITLRLSFLAGGKRHLRLLHRIQRGYAKQRAAGRGELPSNANTPRYLKYLLQANYDLSLKQVCTQTKNIPRLLRVGLGPTSYRPNIIQIICYLFLGFLCMLSNPLMKNLQMAILALAVPLLSIFPVASAFAIKQSVRSTGKEQKLLRLAPAFPAAPHLNEILANIFLRKFLIQAGIYSAYIAALNILVASHVPAFDHYTNLCLFNIIATYLPCGTFFNNYAKKFHTQENLIIIPFLGINMLIAVIGAYSIKTNFFMPFSVSVCIGVTLSLVALMFARQRYRSMLACPPAFPAARM